MSLRIPLTSSRRVVIPDVIQYTCGYIRRRDDREYYRFH